MLQGQKTDQLLQGIWVGVDYKGVPEMLGVINMFQILIVVSFVKTHRTLKKKRMNFILGKLYPNKTDIKKTKTKNQHNLQRLMNKHLVLGTETLFS